MYFCLNVNCPYLYSHLCVYILYNVYVSKRLVNISLYETIKYIWSFLTNWAIPAPSLIPKWSSGDQCVGEIFCVCDCSATLRLITAHLQVWWMLRVFLLLAFNGLEIERRDLYSPKRWNACIHRGSTYHHHQYQDDVAASLPVNFFVSNMLLPVDSEDLTKTMPIETTDPTLGSSD